jgi:hypothetical protein
MILHCQRALLYLTLSSVSLFLGQTCYICSHPPYPPAQPLPKEQLVKIIVLPHPDKLCRPPLKSSYHWAFHVYDGDNVRRTTLLKWAIKVTNDRITEAKEAAIYFDNTLAPWEEIFWDDEEFRRLFQTFKLTLWSLQREVEKRNAIQAAVRSQYNMIFL